MVKYYNAMVVFEEIPDEITLAINITNCPCHCKGCHSQFLWDDVGTELTPNELDALIDENDGITCVCFMGGDREPETITELSRYVKGEYGLKTAWYSGFDEINKRADADAFNYIKIGHYDDELGGLNKDTTNQRLYKVRNIDDECVLDDITYRFHKKRE